MEFIDIPTEQTTAITDVIMALLAFGGLLFINTLKKYDEFKIKIWNWLFIFFSVAAFMGAVGHGFKMSQIATDILWMPISLLLGLLMALFVVAVIYDLKGQETAKKSLKIMVTIAVFFFILITVLSKFVDHYYIVFIIYQSLATFFAFGAYMWLALKKKMPGAGILAAGLFISIFAAAVQATRMMSFTFIWEFDHNSVYHFIQMVGLFFFVWGVRRSVLHTKK